MGAGGRAPRSGGSRPSRAVGRAGEPPLSPQGIELVETPLVRTPDAPSQGWWSDTCAARRARIACSCGCSAWSNLGAVPGNGRTFRPTSSRGTAGGPRVAMLTCPPRRRLRSALACLLPEPNVESRTVTIVGRAALTGAGRGIERFWAALRAARPLQETHDLCDARIHDARYVRVREPRMPDGDLASAWLRLACDDALADAGAAIASFDRSRMALFAGSSLGGMTLFEAAHRRDAAAGPGLPVDEVPGFRALYDGPSRRAAEVAASGAWTVNTACSSAANALGLARRWLVRGRIDVALVAGFDVISAFAYSGFRCLGAMDPEPTTPFGAERRGLNLGDAALAFVLVRSADATSGTHIVGFGSSCDAHHLTRPDLGGKGLARAVRAALNDAGVEATQIDLISAHGTGTPYNDTMEAAAFADVFGAAPPTVHCAKPVFGHTLGASGAVDALAVSLMLEHGVVPPTHLRGAEDPELAIHPTRSEASLGVGALAISTSSGFGGSNAVLVMTEHDGQRSRN